jgi:hypothetical protein
MIKLGTTIKAANPDLRQTALAESYPTNPLEQAKFPLSGAGMARAVQGLVNRTVCVSVR